MWAAPAFTGEPDGGAYMNTYIMLPCGCKLTPTTVVAMCMGHAQQWHCENIQREGEYHNWVQRMNDLAASPPRT